MLRKIDLDFLLSNGLLYLILAVYIATVYTAILSLLLAVGLISFDNPLIMFNPPWWVSIIVIVIVALTFLQLRRWLQSRINVLIYGQHDDPFTLISQVNQQLLGMASPQLILPEVLTLIAFTLKLPYVSIEAHSQSLLKIAHGAMPQPSDINSFPMTYLNKSMGELRVGSRRAHESLSTADLDLLRELAQHIGIALYATELTTDLQNARERLVIAREEERRRIRNDLHDGLAPTLSSLQLQLGAIRNLMRENPDQAETIINDLREDIRNATAEIRQLVYDLRPPMLDELGLAGAIKSFKFPDSGISFQVNVPESMPKLSAAVEVAAYRIASEAIHNVVKHAQATECIVNIEMSEHRLTLSVTDNGTSLPHQHRVGVGLQSMQERIAELGGSLSVQPCECGGTCLTAQLPIDSGN